VRGFCFRVAVAGGIPALVRGNARSARAIPPAFLTIIVKIVARMVEAIPPGTTATCTAPRVLFQIVHEGP
jgi:hypothetical protein